MESRNRKPWSYRGLSNNHPVINRRNKRLEPRLPARVPLASQKSVEAEGRLRQIGGQGSRELLQGSSAGHASVIGEVVWEGLPT